MGGGGDSRLEHYPDRTYHLTRLKTGHGDNMSKKRLQNTEIFQPEVTEHEGLRIGDQLLGQGIVEGLFVEHADLG